VGIFLQQVAILITVIANMSSQIDFDLHAFTGIR